ncbi:acetyl-CoA synthetase [Burkholderiaceae bacterium]|nr:acetyl-CoA synthetase [Burkholderiaceae bacterium]
MRDAIIHKTLASLRVAPNMADWNAAREAFSWDQVREELGASADDFNIARLAVDRHVRGAGADRIALRYLPAAGEARMLSYAELQRQTDRFANGLRALGVGKGDRVFILAGRIAPLVVAALGSLKIGCVVTPLFSAFGPEPIATRIGIAQAQVLVTTEALYRRKIEKMRDTLTTLRHVIVIGEGDTASSVAGALDYASFIAHAAETPPPVTTGPDDMALLHFTSGTTGTPKGAVHVHGAALMHFATGRYALDLHPDDVFWCTADPGWVTGTSYGIIAPLLHGVTSVVDEAEFDAERWYRILQDEEVSVWYTAPTAIRMLMKAGPQLARRYRFPKLRFIASVGEPLNPEAVWWGQEVLGLPIHDNWWQTETGGIMIANTPALDIKPGSMGKPLPGVDAAIVRRHEGRVEVIEEPGVEGELALRTGWPSMFRAYLGQDERYRKCFAGDLYLTGDLARRDADGYYWFVGRADDVIKSAGHLIGPFEVESVLMEHPAVAEAGVIGKPDPIVGELVKAFVSLKQGIEPTEALRMDLLGHARKRLGAAVAPKEIAFLPTLPRTRSGKIMRRLLKARELGLPEGDISTLEGSE